MGSPRRETPLTDEELREWLDRESDRRFMEAPAGGWPHGQRVATRYVDMWQAPGWSETEVEVRPRLKEIRLRQLLTQRQLADRSGVSVSTISRIESGLTDRMRMETWETLAKALGVKPTDLVEISERPMTFEELKAREDRIARRKEKEAARQRARRERDREERQRASA